MRNGHGDLRERPVAVEIAAVPSSEPTPWWSALAWWIATLAVLVVLDDLTFGPLFWLTGFLSTPQAAAAAAFVISLLVQVYVVWQGTRAQPSRPAAFMLNRLHMERRNANVAAREKAMHRKVGGAVSAILLSPVIGGIIPTMLLWKAGYSTRFVRRLSVPAAAIYAAEFALLHGLAPGWVR